MKRWSTALGARWSSLLVVACCACGPDSTEIPEVAPNPAERGTELVFRLTRHDRRPDGSQRLSAAGLLQGRPVGFDLELGAWLENAPGFVNMSTWQCTAWLRSQGEPSNELLRLLDSLYATHAAPMSMVPSVELQVFSPWENPGDFENGPCKVILLFPPMLDSRGEGAELKLEVDVDEQRIYLREKDPRYRAAVMEALGASV